MQPLLSAVSTAATSAPAGQPPEAKTAVLLFVVLAALLGMLVLGVILANISRRHRRNLRKVQAQKPLVDPWQEAGARVKAGD